MPNTPTTVRIAELDIGIEKVAQKVAQAEKMLTDKGSNLQFTDELKKSFEEIRKTLDQLSKTKPVSTSSSKDMARYTKDIGKLESKLTSLISKTSKIEIDNSSLIETVDTLKKLNDQYQDLQKKLQANEEKIKGVGEISGEEGDPYYQKRVETRKKMINAAMKGDSEGLSSAYGEMSTQIRGRIAKVTKWRDAAVDKGDTALAEKHNETLQKLIAAKTELLTIDKQLNNYVKERKNLTTQVEGVEIEQATETAKEEERANGVRREANELLRESVKETNNLGVASDQSAKNMAEMEQASRSFDQITSRLTYMFSAASIFMTLRRVVQSAVRDFQELDKQFNEIAIVSKYSTKEMWDSFSQVNKMAQEYGVTTKNILEVQNLYYHQGKDMAEVNKLTAQTLTLAKITGMDYEEATNKLTAALNAYKLEAEDAVRVTDTVAALSANAATSSQELMTALTKTASIAANAGMSLENTEVFLTKMIETTREAPENLGTALKTIVARFGEVKNAIDENGEAIERADINKVDKALGTVGISLLDTAGQIRDLDDVFMELSSKWDNLDRNTQRYIATIAAGSRQQSRFIAMMENYDRTLELVDVAQNAAGTGARQLAKAQESIETAVNRLKSTWQEFYASFIKSGMIRWVLDLANNFVGLLNKLNDLSPALGALASATALYLVKTKVLDKVIIHLGASMNMLNGSMTIEQALKRRDIALDNLKNKSLTGIIKRRIVELKELKAGNAEQVKRIALSTQEAAATFAQEISLFSLNKKEKERIALTVAETLADKELTNELKEEAITTALLDLKKKGLNKTRAESIAKTLVEGKTVEASGEKSVGILGKIASAAMAHPIIATAIVAAIIAIGVAISVVYNKWKKNHKVIVDNSEALDKLNEKLTKYKEQVEKTKTLKDNIDIIKKYGDAVLLTAEQQEELTNAQKAIGEEYPQLLEYIDEEGNYHLKLTDALEAEYEAQKKLNKEKRDAYNEENKRLIGEGVYGDSFSAFERAKNSLSGLSQTLGLSSESEDEQANKITKDIIGYGKVAETLGLLFGNQSVYSVARNDQLRKIMKGFLSGSKVSFTTQDLNTVFGTTADLDENQFKKFREAAANQDLSDFSVFQDTLAKAGINAPDAYIKEWYDNYMQIVSKIPAIGDMITKGYAEVQKAWEQTLNVSLSEVDFDFSVTSESKARFAKAFAEAFADDDNFTTDDFLKYIEGLDEETYNKIFSKILSPERIELKEIFGENFQLDDLFTETSSLDKINEILNKYLEKNGIDPNSPEAKAYRESLRKTITFSDEEIEGMKLVLSDEIDQLGGYTLEQIRAMQNTAAKLRDVYGDNASKAYRKIKENIAKELGPASKNFEKAINTLNTIDVSDLNSIKKFIKEMKKLGVSTKTTSKTIIDFAGGLDKLPLGDTQTLIDYCTSSLEDMKNATEALSAASQGSASVEQMQSLLQVLTTGLDFSESIQMIHKFNESIYYTGKGIGLNAQILQQAQNDIASGEKTTTEVILGLIEARIKARKTELAAATDVAKREQLQNEIFSLELNKSILTMSANYEQQMAKHARDEELEKEKEKLDRIKEAWENFLKYLNDVDRYSNLDAFLDRIQEKIGNLEFEIEFSTNSDEIAKDYKSLINEINRDMAGNMAGKRGAESNLLARRNAILNNPQTSGYISFGADGNLILNQEKMLKLEEKIRDAKIKDDTVTLAVLEGQKKAIEDNVKSYNDELKAVQKYTKGVQDSLKATQDFNKKLYENVVELENKLIDVIQEREDKELEAVKKKYDAIKEEDNKYLDSVRKMIDKERALREQKNDEDAVRDKERKLAMMKMDTSGIYSSEIRALEKELKQDYQDLSDKAVDRMVDQLEEENNARAESMDKDVYYTETVLERKRELMTAYYQEIQDLDDAAMQHLLESSQEYIAASKTQKELLKEQYLDLIGNGEASKEVLQDGSIASVQRALELAQESATELDEAIQLYGDNAKVTNGEVQISVSNLAGEYSNLVSIIDGDGNSLVSAYTSLAKAINECAKAEEAYNKEKEKTKNPGGVEDPEDNGDKDKSDVVKTVDDIDYELIEKVNLYDEQIFSDDKKTKVRSNLDPETLQKLYKERNDYARLLYEKYGGWASLPEEWVKDAVPILPTYEVLEKQLLKKQSKSTHGGGGGKFAKFATGGLVDYTGPAWVDGSKTNPEAFLSAADTANIAKLRDILSIAFDSTAPTYPNSQSTSNATYNITIEVDSIASDYDVDQAVSHLEDKIKQASGYRNINILKKSK